MIVLDSDIVTLLDYGRNDALRKKIEAIPDDEVLAVTLISRMEILGGRIDSVRKAADEGELSRAMERYRGSEALLNSFVTLEVDAVAAAHFERLRKHRKTRNMRRGDMLIACITLAHDAVLVTRNISDFQPVGGLRVENWAD